MVNNKFDHITMENVKEYFMYTKCHPSNRDADWDLADEYRKLNIDKKIVNEWINEYYESEFDNFILSTDKCIEISQIVSDFYEALRYNLMKKYFTVYIDNIDHEEDNGLKLRNFLRLIYYKNESAFGGIIYICYINKDYELMNRAINELKRQIVRLDGYEYNIGGGHKSVFNTKSDEELLNEFIKKYLEK